MGKTRPSPDWVLRLLKQLTPDEQAALREYRLTLGKNHARHARQQLTHAQLTRIWAGALDKLADASQGGDPLARYLARQLEHLENWAAGGTAT